MPSVQYLQFISVCARGGKLADAGFGFTVKVGNTTVWRAGCTPAAPTYLANLGEAGIHVAPNTPLSVNVPAAGSAMVVDVSLNGIGF